MGKLFFGMPSRLYIALRYRAGTATAFIAQLVNNLVLVACMLFAEKVQSPDDSWHKKEKDAPRQQLV